MGAARRAFRSIRRAPLFSGLVVLLLAAGIGANVLIYTALNALLLRPLPVFHPEQLIRLGVQRSPALTSFDHPYIYARVLGERARSFGAVFTSWPSEVTAESAGRVQLLTANLVSPNYFSALGVEPAIGRAFTSGDESVAILGHAFWRQSFGARADVIGSTIRVRGTPLTVIGVLDARFTGLDLDNRCDLWIPAGANPGWAGSSRAVRGPAQVYARLLADLASAEAELRTLYPSMVEADLEGRPQFNATHIASEKAMRPVLISASRGNSILRKQFAGAVSALMGGVVALWLLVCGNIGGLMLAREQTRRREIGILLALGGTRLSILRRAAFENGLLAAAGALAGLSAAWWAGPWLASFLPARSAVAASLRPDLSVGVIAALGGVLSCALISAIPAVSAFRTDPSMLMRRETGRVPGPGVSRGLVASQVALATLLVAGGIFLGRTLAAIRAQDPGFRRANLIVAEINPQTAGVPSAQVPSLFDEIVRRARLIPGVENVSVAQRALMRGVGFKGSAAPAGARITFAGSFNVSLNGVSLEHFTNMGIRILRGRAFQPDDLAAQPRRVMVSESFVRQFFADGDPVGKRFGMGRLGSIAEPANEIIGVVNDAKYRSMREVPPPTIYGLLGPEDLRFGGAAVHIAVRGSATGIIASVRKMLSNIGPGIAPSNIATMEQEIETSLWQERLLAALSAIFAALSSALAGAGLFGMLAYAVSRRTREIGIRVALGATAAGVARLVSRSALGTVLPGVAAGLAAYAAASRAIRSLLYGVGPADPWSLSAAALIVLAIASVACVVPALRALRINPSDALREE